ncbi:MAG TPA: histidine kinase [Terriglobales bacterium]|nr:histidine kinase [Terriglobales bacterium]
MSPEENLRTERWLASARVFLAFGALIAVWLAPEEVRSPWAYVLLGFYIAHATAILILLRSPQQSSSPLRLMVHCVDVLWPALISPYTVGQNNPFFLFFVFVLAAAAYRWGLWETVMTAVASVSLLWLESVSFKEGILRALNTWATHHRMPAIQVKILGMEPKELFMGSVSLIIMGLLLGYLAERQKKLGAEKDIAARMLRLVRVDVGLAGSLSHILSELVRLYGAKRVLIVTRESGSHRVHTGELESNSVLPELRWNDAGPLASEAYLKESRAETWYAKRGEKEEISITGLDPSGSFLRIDAAVVRGFADLYEFQSVAASSFSFSHELTGRIFLFDPNFRSGNDEELGFLQDLIRQITPAVYNLYLLRRLRTRAGAAERARLVRELHDGAVQSLIGVEMQVDVLRRHAPEATSMTDELERIQGLLREEVLKLRELMQEMKSTAVDARRLAGYLRDTVQRFQRETGIAAQFVMDGDEIVLPSAVCRELARIAQEALVNVRKHSGARQVIVQLLQEDGGWQLIVEDDGAGFPFSGRISQSELDASGKAPTIIRERVRLIQADLTIESKPGKGSRIEVFVPLLQPVEVGTGLRNLFT